MHVQRPAKLHKPGFSRNTSRSKGVTPARSEGTLPRCFKFLGADETWKISSYYIRDEERKMLHDPELLLGSWVRFFSALLNAKSDKFKPDIVAGIFRGLLHTLSRFSGHRPRNRSLKVGGEYEGSGNE